MPDNVSDTPPPAANPLVVNAIAAFPWVTCNEPIEVGSARILPYERGLAPGDLTHAKQTDIDTIMAAWADRPGQPVTRASLLEIDDYRTGMDAGAHAYKLFQTRKLITFAALAQRRLFGQHFGYCNSHTYLLIVQRYVSGEAERFSFASRRRDGGVSHMWATDKFAHYRPSHVYQHAKFKVDRPLLAALLKLPEESPVREAVDEFNSANTDSDDVPVHVEVVMVKSAFEWLLGIDEKVGNFVTALDVRLSTILGAPRADGPLADRWRKRWPKAQRPLEAWVRDFCAARNAAAHGSPGASDLVWPDHTHLAFASIFFPLALKSRLADDSLLTLDESDRELL
jgi:hypothetical protein